MPPQPVPTISVHASNIIPPIFVALSSDGIVGRCQCAVSEYQWVSQQSVMVISAKENRTIESSVYCHCIGHPSSTKVLLVFWSTFRKYLMQTRWKGRSKWQKENCGRVCGEPTKEDIDEVYNEQENNQLWKEVMDRSSRIVIIAKLLCATGFGANLILL